MKKTIKLALFLGIVAAISGLILGFVNSLTEPVIQERSLVAEKANLELMYPGAEFKQVNYTDESGTILGVYEAVGEGYIFKATGTGYNSSNPIICLIGITKDGAIDNVVPLQQQETNGFGARCFEQSNIDNLYVGAKSADEVDMLSGATLTSTAMKNMITKSFEAYEKIK